MKYSQAPHLRSTLCLLLALLLTVGMILPGCSPRISAPSGETETSAESSETVPEDPLRLLLQEKLALLKPQVFEPETLKKLGKHPADSAGFVVFFSICNGLSRASVAQGTGVSMEQAWETACSNAEHLVVRKQLMPLWVKADVVSSCRKVTHKELEKELKDSRREYFRWGVSFDPLFQVALLEEEMNSAKVYDYEDGEISRKYLRQHLTRTDRPGMEEIPRDVFLFQCRRWFCGEDSQVLSLHSTGRRKTRFVDQDLARDLILHGSDYLMDQVQEDGSFHYGYYPRFDNPLEGYNIIRHVSTIWSLLCRYRMEPDPDLEEKIRSTIAYAVRNVVYEDPQTAYLLEQESQEIKLGAGGMAIVAMTEYMDVFGTREYEELCCQLGNGILRMQNPSDGSYVHILNPDFTLKETHRTVYYDGEATFALSRLYGLTKDPRWLSAACLAADHFIKEDYAGYRDHWVAYAMNEITKYVEDRPDYYEFALHNAESNLDYFISRETTCPTCLELLMAAFETYLRIQDRGYEVRDFHPDKLIYTISVRTKRQLEGYFFPEYAMYMENPARILNTFLVRHDGFRVRIDDVQHNIGGLYLFCKNYPALEELGYPGKKPKD